MNQKVKTFAIAAWLLTVLIVCLVFCYGCGSDQPTNGVPPATVEEHLAAAKRQATANCDALCVLQAIIDGLDPVEDATLIQTLEVVVLLIEAENRNSNGVLPLANDPPPADDPPPANDPPPVNDPPANDPPSQSEQPDPPDTPMATSDADPCGMAYPNAQGELYWLRTSATIEEGHPAGMGDALTVCASKYVVGGPVEFSLVYQDGTAVQDRDYKARGHGRIIEAGERTHVNDLFTWAVDDNHVNAPRQYTIMLATTSSGWTVSQTMGTLTVTVVNDDHLWVHVNEDSNPPYYTFGRPHDFPLTLHFLHNGNPGQLTLPPSEGNVHPRQDIIPQATWSNGDTFEVTLLSGGPRSITHQIHLNLL